MSMCRSLRDESIMLVKQYIYVMLCRCVEVFELHLDHIDIVTSTDVISRQMRFVFSL